MDVFEDNVVSRGKKIECMYRSSAKDLLFGGEGHDLIVGGGGNDAILGDGDVTYASRDWSFAVIRDGDTIWAHTLWTLGIDRTEGTVSGDDAIFAGAGDDFVNAGGGDDEVHGGPGNDSIFGSSGDDFIDGGAGNDILVGDEFSVPIAEQGNDYIDGGVGNDCIRGDAGSDDLFGGEGDDVIFGDGEVDDERAGDDYLDGEAGDDRLCGGRGSDTIFGGAGNDYIEGDFGPIGAGNDYLDGEVGDDTILGKAGNDEIFGGDGNDWLQGDDGDDYLDGEGGSDTILGGEGDDIMFGGDGNDHLQGDDGDDYLDGGSGNDVLMGGEGNDEVYGDSGNDTIWAGEGADVIHGGLGNDTIYAEAGTNTLYGDEGNDQIYGGIGIDYIEGGAGNDSIFGGAGADEIYGGEGDDTMWGDSGNDVLAGGPGNDTYIVQDAGDIVVEYENEGIDTVRSFVEFELSDAIENLTVMGFNAVNVIGNALDNVLTGDYGANYLYGGEGNDTLCGYRGDDILDGGPGNDKLYGGDNRFWFDLRHLCWNTDLIGNYANGNDTYRFGRGSGQDIIYDRDSEYPFMDTILLGSDIEPSDVRLARVGSMWMYESDSLSLSLASTSDALTVQNWFDETGEWQVERIQFADGTVWDVPTIKQMVMRGTPGDDYLVGYGTDDTLDGGAGNDFLRGERGNDTYIFGRGYGQDSVREFDETAGNVDTILLTPDVRPEDITLIRAGNDLYLTIHNTPDRLRVQDWFSDDVHKVEQIQFADGTVWDSTAIYQIVNTPSDADDYLIGTPTDDVIDGGGGNDVIAGWEGGDTLYGGTGDDSLFGEYGDDLLFGGSGADSLYGQEGDDVLYGGADDDYLDGGDGTNELYGGEGNDTLIGSCGVNVIDGGPGNDYIDGRGDGENIYVLNRGSGFDSVQVPLSENSDHASSVRFSEGIAPEDIVVHTGVSWSGEPLLAIGIGNDEGMLIKGYHEGGGGPVLTAFGCFAGEGEGYGNDDGDGPGVSGIPIRRFVFADGRELSLDEILTRVDRGVVIGERSGTDSGDVLRGSMGEDYISGNEGDDIIGAGLMNDEISGGSGDDVIAGGKGDDYLMGDEGNDVFAYNRGDGYDYINPYPGRYSSDLDTLSFGKGIQPVDVFAFVERYSGDVCIMIAGSTDRIDIPWFIRYYDWSTRQYTYRDNLNAGISRIQFINAEGDARVFDLAGIVIALKSSLIAATESNPLPLFTVETAGFELTESVPPAGGDYAVAYAQAGDLFAVPTSLSGSSGDDVLNGCAGNDTIDAGEGNNLVNAGDGDNTVVAGSGDDVIVSGRGHDVIRAGGGNNVVSAGDGDNIITTGSGDDRITSGSGDDGISAGAGNDVIDAGAGNDTIDGGAGIDVIHAGDGNDILSGGSGYDELMGGRGSDTYVFNVGDGVDIIWDKVSPLEGNQILFGAGITRDDLTLTRNGDRLTILVGNNGDAIHLLDFDQNNINGSLVVRTLEFADGTRVELSELLEPGTEGDDVITTGPADDVVHARGGNDVVSTDGGNDTIDGGSGNDIIYAGPGDDVIMGGIGHDVLDGGEGNDRYIYNPGDGLDRLFDASGQDALVMGPGLDYDHTIIRLGSAEARLRLLDGENNETAEGIDMMLNPDSSIPVETILFADGTTYKMKDLVVESVITYGTNRSDRIVTGRNDDTIYAGNGCDIVSAGLSNDTIYGGNGDDVLFGDGGSDKLYGENGDDTLWGGSGDDLLDGGHGGDVMFGGDGNDLYIVDCECDVVCEYENQGTDTVQSASTYTLGAHVENLTLTGNKKCDGNGNDLDNILVGNAGRNTLNGGYGNDTFEGGRGNDTLIGEAGSDSYVFRRTDGKDTITETGGIDGDVDIVKLTDGIKETEPVIVKQNNDLYLFVDRDNYVRVTSQFTQANYGIERLEVTDGWYITRADIENIVNTMSAINNDPGMDVIQKFNVMRSDPLYTTVLAQSWHQA